MKPWVAPGRHVVAILGERGSRAVRAEVPEDFAFCDKYQEARFRYQSQEEAALSAVAAHDRIQALSEIVENEIKTSIPEIRQVVAV